MIKVHRSKHLNIGGSAKYHTIPQSSRKKWIIWRILSPKTSCPPSKPRTLMSINNFCHWITRITRANSNTLNLNNSSIQWYTPVTNNSKTHFYLVVLEYWVKLLTPMGKICILWSLPACFKSITLSLWWNLVDQTKITTHNSTNQT